MNENNDEKYLELEEKLLVNKNKKQKRKYLNPNAKAFMHKFLKMIK